VTPAEYSELWPIWCYHLHYQSYTYLLWLVEGLLFGEVLKMAISILFDCYYSDKFHSYIRMSWKLSMIELLSNYSRCWVKNYNMFRDKQLIPSTFRSHLSTKHNKQVIASLLTSRQVTRFWLANIYKYCRLDVDLSVLDNIERICWRHNGLVYNISTR
jgi:hypothetical protein